MQFVTRYVWFLLYQRGAENAGRENSRQNCRN